MSLHAGLVTNKLSLQETDVERALVVPIELASTHDKTKGAIQLGLRPTFDLRDNEDGTNNFQPQTLRLEENQPPNPKPQVFARRLRGVLFHARAQEGEPPRRSHHDGRCPGADHPWRKPGGGRGEACR